MRTRPEGQDPTLERGCLVARMRRERKKLSPTLVPCKIISDWDVTSEQ
jgi:hypothetical protein